MTNGRVGQGDHGAFIWSIPFAFDLRGLLVLNYDNPPYEGTVWSLQPGLRFQLTVL